MNMLELCGIRKEYIVAGGGSFMALDDINAVFGQGELVSLIGESGSGKSTLMNVIGGLDTHYSGSILVEGENISKAKKDIEDTLDTINDAYEKLLDNFFEEAAMDVSTDITVLQGLMAQEGLTAQPFGSTK